MSNDPYFIRVSKLTPTRFWINNPTRGETDLAIKNGAVGCTANPSYGQKMLDHPDEGSYAYQLLLDSIHESLDGSQAAEIFQRKLVKPICERFLPLFEKNPERDGYVSIQGDPIDDENGDEIIRQARENRRVA